MLYLGEVSVQQLCLDRGGHRALATCGDGTLQMINLDNFTVHSEPLQGLSVAAVNCAAIAADDKSFVTGHSDATFSLWRM